jgi:hypothetical protein
VWPPCVNSFAPGTEVLMADGSRKPIELVRVGDHVGNAEPDASATQPHPVTAVHVSDDDRDLDELAVDTPQGPRSIATTAHHLFWDTGKHAWTAAADLKAGDRLQGVGGARASVAASREYTGGGRTYNLTVDRVHTYFVFAGETPVLVHNDRCGGAKSGRVPLTRKPIFGDYPDIGQTSLYIIVDPAKARILKVGISGNPSERYKLSEFADWNWNYDGRYEMRILRNFDTSTDARAVEYYMAQRMGGPENNEKWAATVPTSRTWDQVYQDGIQAWQAGTIGPIPE